MSVAARRRVPRIDGRPRFLMFLRAARAPTPSTREAGITRGSRGSRGLRAAPARRTESNTITSPCPGPRSGSPISRSRAAARASTTRDLGGDLRGERRSRRAKAVAQPLDVAHGGRRATGPWASQAASPPAPAPPIATACSADANRAAVDRLGPGPRPRPGGGGGVQPQARSSARRESAPRTTVAAGSKKPGREVLRARTTGRAGPGAGNAVGW